MQAKNSASSRTIALSLRNSSFSSSLPTDAEISIEFSDNDSPFLTVNVQMPEKASASNLPGKAASLESESDPAAAANVSDIDLRSARILGRGAFGAVYLAHFSGHTVAVKVLHMDKREDVVDLVQRFGLEIAAISKISHANCVRFLAASISVDSLAIVTDFCVNGDLSTLIHQDGFFSRTQQVTILFEVARAMAYLHEKGIVHRDLKPENVLLSTSFHAQVADFGLSEAASSNMAYAIAGTPSYMAPEVMLGQPNTFPADVWSFGTLAWESMTRTRPSSVRSDPYAPPGSLALSDARCADRPRSVLYPNLLVDALERIFSRDPSARPTFLHVLDVLALVTRITELEAGCDAGDSYIMDSAFGGGCILSRARWNEAEFLPHYMRVTGRETGCTPLHFAASSGDVERVRLLLAKGISPLTLDHELFCALNRASSVEVRQMLLAHGGSAVHSNLFARPLSHSSLLRQGYTSAVAALSARSQLWNNRLVSLEGCRMFVWRNASDFRDLSPAKLVYLLTADSRVMADVEAAFPSQPAHLSAARESGHIAPAHLAVHQAPHAGALHMVEGERAESSGPGSGAGSADSTDSTVSSTFKVSLNADGVPADCRFAVSVQAEASQRRIVLELVAESRESAEAWRVALLGAIDAVREIAKRRAPGVSVSVDNDLEDLAGEETVGARLGADSALSTPGVPSNVMANFLLTQPTEALKAQHANPSRRKKPAHVAAPRRKSSRSSTSGSASGERSGRGSSSSSKSSSGSNGRSGGKRSGGKRSGSGRRGKRARRAVDVDRTVALDVPLASPGHAPAHAHAHAHAHAPAHSHSHAPAHAPAHSHSHAPAHSHAHAPAHAHHLSASSSDAPRHVLSHPAVGGVEPALSAAALLGAGIDMAALMVQHGGECKDSLAWQTDGTNTPSTGSSRPSRVVFKIPSQSLYLIKRDRIALIPSGNIMASDEATCKHGNAMRAEFLFTPLMAKIVLMPEHVPAAAMQSAIDLLGRLSTVSHPNVASLLGVCIDRESSAVLLLNEELSTFSFADTMRSKTLESRPRMSLHYLYEIALGLEFLHRFGVVHGALKPQNVLFDESGVPRLIHYGMHTLRGLLWPTLEAAASGVCPLYGAPELLRTGSNAPATPESDIWSLGVLIWAAFHTTRGFVLRPYEFEKRTQANLAALPGSIGQSLPSELKGLLLACLQADPALRPTASQVVSCLSELRVRANTLRFGRDYDTPADMLPTSLDIRELLSSAEQRGRMLEFYRRMERLRGLLPTSHDVLRELEYFSAMDEEAFARLPSAAVSSLIKCVMNLGAKHFDSDVVLTRLFALTSAASMLDDTLVFARENHMFDYVAEILRKHADSEPVVRQATACLLRLIRHDASKVELREQGILDFAVGKIDQLHGSNSALASDLADLVAVALVERSNKRHAFARGYHLLLLRLVEAHLNIEVVTNAELMLECLRALGNLARELDIARELAAHGALAVVLSALKFVTSTWATELQLPTGGALWAFYSILAGSTDMIDNLDESALGLIELDLRQVTLASYTTARRLLWPVRILLMLLTSPVWRARARAHSHHAELLGSLARAEPDSPLLIACVRDSLSNTTNDTLGHLNPFFAQE